jgi:O-antigen ligase
MIWMLGGYMWLFIHRPFEVWPILGAMQVERVYMIVMLAFWAVAPGKKWVPNRLHFALIGFFVVLMASWLTSPYMPLLSDTVENYCKVVVFYLLVVTTVHDEKGLRRLVQMYLIAVAIYMGHSFLERLHGRIQWRQGISRMVGVDVTYGDPNAFAAGLVYALTMTLAIWADKPGKTTRLLLWCFTGLACMCIALTGSRAGFAGLILCGMLSLWLSGRKKTILLMGVLGLVGVLVMPGELQNRFLTLIDSSYGPKNARQSAEGRIDGLIYGFAAWQQSPVLGHGPDSFRWVTGRHGGAHNVYGQIISEVGALGALAFIGILLGFAANSAEARRYYRGRPVSQRDLPFYVCRAIGINVVLLCFLGWAGHNLYRYYWLWFAAFQMIALHCIRQKALALAPRTAPARPGFTTGRPALGWA